MNTVHNSGADLINKFSSYFPGVLAEARKTYDIAVSKSVPDVAELTDAAFIQMANLIAEVPGDYNDTNELDTQSGMAMAMLIHAAHLFTMCRLINAIDAVEIGASKHKPDMPMVEKKAAALVHLTPSLRQALDGISEAVRIEIGNFMNKAVDQVLREGLGRV